MSSIAQIQAAATEAGRGGRPHTGNPYDPAVWEELTWFAAWHLAKVECELGEKLLPGLPDAASGLLMYAQKDEL